MTRCPDLLRFSCSVALLFCFSFALSAQTCHSDSVDVPSLTNQVEHASDPNTIFRAAASAGKQMVPVLRGLAKPDTAVTTISGAAQVSLAKLGDANSFSELVEGMKGKSPPIRKLVRVGDDRAISVLMTFLAEHQHDESLRIDFGDYSEDIREEIMDLLSKQLEIGPLVSPQHFSVSIDDWVEWWNLKKGEPIALSISNRLRDPYLKCLARKVEWGFPDAIFDMANTRNQEILPVLRTLERVGRQDFSLKTIHGRAQFALAELGDEEAFEAISRNLDIGDYGPSIEALRMLGGRHAVAALVNAVISPEFTRYHLSLRGSDPETIARAQRERDGLILRTLSSMIADPPGLTGDLESQKMQWKEWWEKNKDSAQFTSAPAKTYE